MFILFWSIFEDSKDADHNGKVRIQIRLTQTKDKETSVHETLHWKLKLMNNVTRTPLKGASVGTGDLPCHAKGYVKTASALVLGMFI